ncbi:MAG TPA: T9SS type A sorting domain-containing protein [Saprospiraceae bacterium]|nr:T9SS type A sorting domain-containing protein [Saprospiraceae bacterium]
MINNHRKTIINLFSLLFLSTLNTYGQNVPVLFEDKESHKEKIVQLNPISDYFDAQHQRSFWEKRDLTTTYSKGLDEWESLGPSTVKSSEGIDFYVSGRVRSIDFINKDLIRIGSGSGGIWEYKKNNDQVTFRNISDGVSSPWTGGMDSSPFDENIILYGTGEPAYKIGTGMWRTTDGGTTWKNINMPSPSQSYYELKFGKVKGRVWAIGDDAYYSKDDGLTWSMARKGHTTGLAVNPTYPDTAFIGQFGDCVYRTYNGGSNWTKLTTPHGLPAYSRGKIKLAISQSNPNIVYALYANISNLEESVYKTIDGGNTWTKCIILDANGKEAGIGLELAPHTGILSVSPTNPDHVAIGAFWYAISNDGYALNGPTSGSHVDYHAIEWSDDGETIFFGTDGGVTFTDFDSILDLKFELTKIPTLQFVSIEAGKTNSNILIGGTQDNGFIYKVGDNPTWYYATGDGGDVALDPLDENIYYGTLGFSGEPIWFPNVRKPALSIDGWVNTVNGILPSTEFGRIVRTAKLNNLNVLTTQTRRKIYYSINKGDLWLNYSLPSFNPFSGIKSMEFTHENLPRFVVSSDFDASSSILLIDIFKGEVLPISDGLPLLSVNQQGDDFTFPKIYTTPANPNKLYAFMIGKGNHYSEYLFETDLNEINWKNISGNLEKLPYTCMLVHPHDDNVILLGTDGYGMFRTINGGIDWEPWDENIARGALISDMDYQIVNDSVFAVISTYGCGIYKRYLGPKTTNTSNVQNQSISSFISPEGLLVIQGINENSNITVFDTNGRVMDTHLERLSDNTGMILFDVSHWSSGIYFLSESGNKKFKTLKLVKI